MSVSRVAFGAVLAIVATASVSGCQVSVKTKTRFSEQNVQYKDLPAWNGEAIEISSEGVGVAVNGGVSVTADPAATTVTAAVNYLGVAFEKTDADQSIVDAKASFTITQANGKVIISCKHGNTHGGSNGGESGCEQLTVIVPGGSATKPLELKVLSGNGDLKLQLAGAVLKTSGTLCDAPAVALCGNSNGGDINAAFPATPGASISFVSSKADDIFATMPSTFAADEILINADTDKVVNSFSDAKIGAGAGGRGTKGTGLASLKLSSVSFAGSTGTVTLR